MVLQAAAVALCRFGHQSGDVAMNTNTLMIIIAGVAGIVAAGLGFFFLQSTSGGGTTEQIARPQIDVVAAARDIPLSAVVDADRDLQIISIDAESDFAVTALKKLAAEHLVASLIEQGTACASGGILPRAKTTD
jgi:hypothetical protein